MGYGTYGALTKPVENIVKKTAENKVYNILASAQKKGQVATKEQIDNLIKNEINKINDNILTGSLAKSAKTIPATAVDTASMAVADYGLNSLQGKQELSLPEQLKSYAPLIAFGGLPAVSHIAGKSAKKVLESNVVKDFVNKNNNVSSLTGEISNALGVNTNYENADKFQELDKKVQGYNMPAQKHYTSDEINFSENINNLSDKEKRMFLQYLTKGLNVDKSLKKTLSKTKNEVKEINNKVQEDNNLEKQIIENVFGEEVLNVPKEYAHIMRRISKDMEKKRIKRGLITPEQAINRKKQILNGQKGEAAYVPMYSGNTPIEETIDITRNYNSGRESKVGLYGKAVKKRCKRHYEC